MATQPPDPAVPDPDSSQPDNLGNTLPTIDSQISHDQQLTYWTSQSADVNGMLGGYPQVSRIDLQGSKTFIAKIRRLSRIAGEAPSPTISKNGKAPASVKGGANTKVRIAVDCGAGIGRITTGLLLNIAEEVDVVEPVKKFTDVLAQAKTGPEQGKIGQLYNVGLESWSPPPDRKYDLVWNQWCLGHLTDKQVVDYLRRVSRSLAGSNTNDQNQQEGWIMVKENLSTDQYGEDIFDDADSSITRSDQKFQLLFEEAGLKIVKMETQTGFPKSLFPVKMYALRPK